jgi:mRNA-degrading endonuclease RelE of RelBE toxin-antitoxin system
MNYEIKIHPKAIKELSRFPKEMQKLIVEKLRVLTKEFNKPKSNLDIRKMRGKKKEPQLYRLRAGDYRVVFEFSDEVIWIARISHRRDSYRGL